MESLRSISLRIFNAALSQVNACQAVSSHLSLEDNHLRIADGSSSQKVDLKRFKNISVLGAGKAAVPMAAACEKLFKDKLHSGLIITKYGHSRPLSRIEAVEAGHPLPDQSGFLGSSRILSLLRAASSDTLIVFLTSGGCSALYTVPAASLTLRQKQLTTDLLLRAGATIQELNTVRKHLSLVKGGWSAQCAFPATVLNLVLSDVIGDPLDVIGSGPFYPDPSTFKEAWAIIEKYNLVRKVPVPVTSHIRKGLQGLVADTPKPGAPCFAALTHTIIASNRMALQAAEKKARDLGFKTFVLSSQIQGEARELAKFYGAAIREIVQSPSRLKKPLCLLAGGEPTVTVTGKGIGGRNTELALAMALELQGLSNILFLSAGTDGTDGPTDAAGAVASGSTCRQARQKGLVPEFYLSQNDSYTFFRKSGGLIMTGPTGTNVMDLHLLLVRK